jgi:hypothetical protein
MDTTVTVMAAVLRRNRATVPVRVDEERPMNRWQ